MNTGGIDVSSISINSHPLSYSNILGTVPTLAFAASSVPFVAMQDSPWQLQNSALVWTQCNVAIGQSSIDSQYSLQVNGTICSMGDVVALSDSNLKSDIKPIENALEKLSKIGGYTYDRIDRQGNKRYAGVIAQEVLGVLPEAVYDEGQYMSVSYHGLIGLLVEAVKELGRCPKPPPGLAALDLP